MPVAPPVARGYKTSMQFDDIDRRLRDSGFVTRGGFHPGAADNVPVQGQTVGSVPSLGERDTR